MTADTLEQARALARELKAQLDGTDDATLCHVVSLCDLILSDLIARLEAEASGWRRSRDFQLELADLCLSHEGSREHQRHAARFHKYVADTETEIATMKAREAAR